ncbi:MAG: glycosyltransferase [Phycisphaerae bacterium]|nr:glycosyltransferase [Phycisphaerae bacterium]
MAHLLTNRRVALSHHWLKSMRGGEKTLLHIAEIVGDAPIFTLLANLDQLDERLLRHPIHTSLLQKLPGIRRWSRMALPLMPLAVRRMKLTDFDVVICSDAAVAKGMRFAPEALKLCYCHTPMRYVWDLYVQYRREAGLIGGMVLAASAGWLRRWDRTAAERISAFVANSYNVRNRIRRNYGRGSVVIYPPVDLAGTPAGSHEDPENAECAVPDPDDSYLVVSELVGYKRVDLAVRACTRLGRQLVVIGEGPMMPKLQALAGPSVSLLGYQDDATVRDHMRRCKALLFCGEEDFGMTPVEAQSFGRPVIAYGRGGACETVLDGRTGLWFRRPSTDDVTDALERFESGDVKLWPPEQIIAHARNFNAAHFRARFSSFIEWALAEYDKGGHDRVAKQIESLPADHFLTSHQ